MDCTSIGDVQSTKLRSTRLSANAVDIGKQFDVQRSPPILLRVCELPVKETPSDELQAFYPFAFCPDAGARGGVLEFPSVACGKYPSPGNGRGGTSPDGTGLDRGH